MKIAVRGWARDMGEKEILNADLSELSISKDERQTVYRDKPPNMFEHFLHHRLYKRITVAWHQKFRLMGDYRTDIEFSQSDILQLFRAMFGSELDASLIDKHGFTVSEDLKKAVLKTIKLTDLILGELATMSAQSANEQTAQDKPSETAVVRLRRPVGSGQ